MKFNSFKVYFKNDIEKEVNPLEFRLLEKVYYIQLLMRI